MRRYVPPITRLPTEMLVEIFSQCCATFPRPTIRDPPLTLGRVCPQWRHVVYGTPTLWARLDIDWDCTDTYSALLKSRTITTWLKQSEDTQLSFRVRQRYDGPIFDHVANSLLVHRNRWKDVVIDAPIFTIYTMTGGDPLSSCSSLTSLQLKLVQSPLPLTLGRDTWPLPWARLTTLIVEESDACRLPIFPTLTEYFAILANCRDLHNCKLAATLAFEPDACDRVTMTKLQSLNLVLYDETWTGDGVQHADESLGAFIGLIETPSLNELLIRIVVSAKRTDPGTMQPISFSSALATISPNLRSLALAYVPMTEAGLLRCLPAATKLEQLDLRFGFGDPSGDPISDRILGSGSAGLGDGLSGLMSLRHLHLECTGQRCSEGGICEFLQSWIPYCGSSCGRAPGIAYFHMKSRMVISDVTVVLIDTLRGRGIDIAVEQFRLF